MLISNWFKPFQELPKNQMAIVVAIWLLGVLGLWLISSMSGTHLFPTMEQVWSGFVNLYKEGLVVHVASSLWLCLQAVALSLFFSLLIAYLSPLPFIKPVAAALSSLRYLPLTGITFYLVIMTKDARAMQVSVLVIFMSLYFITSLLGILKDIPQEEIDHARSLRCSRWEVLLEVVIKGRVDYVIEVLRQNLAIVWMMLVTVESILVAAGGLGVLIKNSDKFMNHGRIVALQIVILCIGIVIDQGLKWVRKTFFRYSKF